MLAITLSALCDVSCDYVLSIIKGKKKSMGHEIALSNLNIQRSISY